jgi:hypothetical protein
MMSRKKVLQPRCQECRRPRNPRFRACLAPERRSPRHARTRLCSALDTIVTDRPQREFRSGLAITPVPRHPGRDSLASGRKTQPDRLHSGAHPPNHNAMLFHLSNRWTKTVRGGRESSPSGREAPQAIDPLSPETRISVSIPGLPCWRLRVDDGLWIQVSRGEVLGTGGVGRRICAPQAVILTAGVTTS